ncbi:MAG: hypothetical protein H6605_00325 [Flavobacteriales bacterium]|nr:hypothetical protein [Flavobacteriales bacterium]
MKFTFRIDGLICLVIYTLSVLPVSIYHQHHNALISFDKASRCEKVIYFGEKDDVCTHKQHLSNVLEKCSLCEHHQGKTHLQLSYLLPEEVQIGFFFSDSFKRNIASNAQLAFLNRGPPIV